MTSSESSVGWHEIETPELEGIDESEHEDMFLDERKTSKRLGELVKSGSDDGGPSKFLDNYTGMSNYDRVEWCTSWTQRGTETPQEAPKPPRETGSTDWSRYTSYLCRICQDWCLNTKDSKAAETRQCWNCLAELNQLGVIHSKGVNRGLDGGRFKEHELNQSVESVKMGLEEFLSTE